MTHKAQTDKWNRRYRTALRRYLAQTNPASLSAALKLGEEAAALGMETLDVALNHEKALTALEPHANPAGSGETREEQAAKFFAETIAPIEKTHGASLKTAARIHAVTLALQKRNADLKDSARRLEQSSAELKKTEAALDLSEKNRRTLDKEAKKLAALLRKTTREILTTHEKKDKKTSLHLQNEVAQTLLAIDLRLLALKASAEVNTQKISKELDDTQQMVRESHNDLQGKN
jgi:hypothetical protein